MLENEEIKLKRKDKSKGKFNERTKIHGKENGDAMKRETGEEH